MSKFTIQKKKQKNHSAGVNHIVINGEMTIQNAVEIRNALLDTFSEGNNLQLDMKGVTDVDLTGLQVICAAHISSIKIGKNFTLVINGNEPIMKIVHDAGFLRHTGCSLDLSNTCVWTGGEKQ